MDIGDDAVHAGLHDAEGSGGQHNPLIIKTTYQDADALIQGAKDILFRHLTILKHQFAGVGATHAQLVELLCRRKALEILLDDESSNPAWARIGIRFRIDHQHICIRAVGNPELVAVQDIAIAHFIGTEPHGDNI